MKRIDCSELVFLNDAIYQATKKILADALPGADPTWLALSAQALFQDVAGGSQDAVIATLQQANQAIAGRESTLAKDGSYRIQDEQLAAPPAVFRALPLVPMFAPGRPVFYLNPQGDDVGHTRVFAPPRSGKSILDFDGIKAIGKDAATVIHASANNKISMAEEPREQQAADALATIIRTPAAPGIDLTPFRELADAWQKESSEALGQFPPIEGNHRSQMIRLGKCATKLHNLIDASPKGGSDPWRGLYASDRTPNRDEYGCFYHPDIPSWDDEREESIAPLLKAQGFDLQCVTGDFSDEAMEEGGERYWQEMRSWNPEPNGDGWRLVAIYDTEDGPYAMFVKPLAQASDAEVRP